MKKLRVTVDGKSYDVTVEVLEDDAASRTALHRPAATPSVAAPVSAPAPAAPTQPPQPAAAGAIICPMAGLVKAIQVKEGDVVEQGQVLLLLDAMKVENRITAPSHGKVARLHVKEGDTVGEGHVLLELS